MADKRLLALEKEISLLPDELHRSMAQSDAFLQQVSGEGKGTKLQSLSLQFQLQRYDEFLQKLDAYREKLSVLGVTSPGQTPGGMSLVLLDQLQAVAMQEKAQLAPLQNSLSMSDLARQQEDMASRIALKERLSMALKKTNEGD
ncbi:MAG: hypothetical protein K6E18_09480 [Lachnospiraceae bacterium]|nr:hypothetical protein [Lachnospiraceae bacterium]